MAEPSTPATPGQVGEGATARTAAASEASATNDGRRARRVEESVLGTGIVALGAFTVVDAGSLVEPGSANTLGPRAFPYLVGAFLVVAGLAVLVATLRGRLGVAAASEDVDAAAGTDWRTVVTLVALFVAHALLIPRIGWPLAIALLFAGVAWGLGARPWWKPVLIGVGLGFLLQIVFAAGLGLSLPSGPLSWVPFLHD